MQGANRRLVRSESQRKKKRSTEGRGGANDDF